MTVSTAYGPLTYNGNGSSTAFSVTWPFLTGTLVVTLINALGVETVQTLGSHYSVSGGTTTDGSPSTGIVTMATAPASGETLRIERASTARQSAAWSNGGSFQAKTVEATFDKLMLLAQEAAFDNRLSIKQTTTDYINQSSEELFIPESHAGKVIGWDSNGQLANFSNDAVAAEAAASAAASSATAASAAAATAEALAAAVMQPQVRLTLTTALPITSNDVSSATTIYCTPVGGLLVPLWDGSNTVMTSIGAELSLALDSNSGHTGYHQSGKNFDLYIYNDAGMIRLGTGPAWSSDTSRGTGAGTTEIELKNGFYTNKNSMTLRFGSSSGNTVTVAANKGLLVGSVRMTANGTTEDSKQKRFLSNVFNSTLRALLGPICNSGNQYDYSTTTWRAAAGETGQKIEVLQSLPGNAYEAEIQAYCVNSTGTARATLVGLGLDSQSAPSGVLLGTYLCTNVMISYPWTKIVGAMTVGYHYISWLEYGAGSDTQTWLPLGRRSIGWCIN